MLARRRFDNSSNDDHDDDATPQNGRPVPSLFTLSSFQARLKRRDLVSMFKPQIGTHRHSFRNLQSIAIQTKHCQIRQVCKLFWLLGCGLARDTVSQQTSESIKRPVRVLSPPWSLSPAALKKINLASLSSSLGNSPAEKVNVSKIRSRSVRMLSAPDRELSNA